MSNNLTAVILLAGLGSRLGRPHPKCLTPIGQGETILSRQLAILKKFHIPVVAVVGFKKDIIMEAAPEMSFVYNPNFDTTNTSKSLLCAVEKIHHGDILWLNGDVIFDEDVMQRMLDNADHPIVAVNTARTAEEEVKYTTNDENKIIQLSKQVTQAEGEALGINLITREYMGEFKQHLEKVDENDYFERAMETMIESIGPIFSPVDVSDLACIEVDFEEDLSDALKQLGRLQQS